MKIRTLTNEEAQAIFNLRSNKDFAKFLNYIGAYGEDVIQALCKSPNLDNPEYHRGTAGGITEIMEVVEKAPRVLEQYKNQT